MDFQHQYYLSNEFNQKMIKYLNEIDDIESSKKIIDIIFNLLYPATINFVNYKRISNLDVISDFILQVYENFSLFIIKAKSFLKNNENFVFYYYFIKNLYFEWQNFNRKIKTKKNIRKNEEITYLDLIKNNSNVIASPDGSSIDEIKEIIKRCLYNHFEKEEIVMFLTYYYFLLDNKDYIILSEYFNITILSLINLIENENSNKSDSFNSNLDDKLIEKLFNQSISSFRVAITRIKKKMKIKCNYLAENYLFIDEGEI